MEFDIYAIILIIFFTPTVQCNEFFEMSQISQDIEEILHTVNRTTITSCQIFCNREKKCNAIGLKKGSDTGPLYHCHLLKKISGKLEAKNKGKNEVKMMQVSKLADPKPKPAINWKISSFVSATEQAITSPKLMRIIKVTKQYKMQVEVMRTEFQDYYKTVVYFMDDISNLKPIGVRFTKESKHLQIYAPIGNKRFYICDTGLRYPLNDWLKIEASQLKEGDDYIFSVSVDCKTICTLKNTRPRNYDDVKVYVGRDISGMHGSVRNFWMMVEE